MMVCLITKRCFSARHWKTHSSGSMGYVKVAFMSYLYYIPQFKELCPLVSHMWGFNSGFIHVQYFVCVNSTKKILISILRDLH